MKQPVFLAHRGAWAPGRRENTVGAIERAAKSGRFAYIELDVRRTRSDDEGTQTPIIFHDATLDRSYSKYNIPLKNRHRLGQAISGLTIEIIRGEEIEVPTLAEAMRAANGNPLNLEMKSLEAIEPTLEVINDMMSKYPNEWSHEKIVFSAFNWDILYEIKQREPRFGVAMLYGLHSLPKSFGRHYNTLGARWIGFNRWLALILVPLAVLVGVENRYVYTVNSKHWLRIFTNIGANGIFTDQIKPDEM